jgi:hypothetical protein
MIGNGTFGCRFLLGDMREFVTQKNLSVAGARVETTGPRGE